MSHLFDHISDRLFSPLASANRYIYSSVLLDLDPLFVSVPRNTSIAEAALLEP
jgi:hypothetical protein